MKLSVSARLRPSWAMKLLMARNRSEISCGGSPSMGDRSRGLRASSVSAIAPRGASDVRIASQTKASPISDTPPSPVIP